MAQLTKESFERLLDEKLKPLATKKDLAGLEERLGRMIKAGFDGVDDQLAEIVKLLDIRKDVDGLKLQMQEIRHALKLDS